MAALPQLHAACLALQADFTTALTAAGLAAFSGVHAQPPPAAAVAPYLVVTFAGWRRRTEPSPGDWQVRFPVTFRCVTAGGEATALAYEDVVATVLAAARTTLAAGLTDGALTAWRPDRGTAGPDPANPDDGWISEVVVWATVEG